MTEHLSPAAVLTEAPAAPHAWAALIAIGVGSFVLVSTEFLPIGLLPRIATDMSVTDGQAGLLLTLSGYLAAIAAPLTIAFARPFDRRTVLLVLLSLLILANTAMAVAPSFAVLLLGRMVLGLTLGAFWTVGGSLGPRLRPGPQAGIATSIILSGVSLGTIAGVPAGALIGEFIGWRWAFAGAAILALPVLIALALLVPRLPPTSASGLKELGELLKLPGIRFGLLATIVTFVGQFAGYTYITPFLLQFARIDPLALGAVLFGFGVAGLAGNMLGGWIVGKNVGAALIGTLVLLGASVSLLTVAQADAALAVPLVLVWGLGFGMHPIAMQSWMFGFAPGRIESVQALFVSAAQGSIGTGALMGGLLVDHFGIDSALWLAAGTALATALFVARERTTAIGRQPG